MNPARCSVNALLALALGLFSHVAVAQSDVPSQKPVSDWPTQTFHPKYADKYGSRGIASVLTALLPAGSKVLQIDEPNAIVVRARADQLAYAQKLIDELDRPSSSVFQLQTFYLNADHVSDANEIYTAVRQMLPPETKSYFIPSQNAIIVRGTADQMETVRKILADVNKPKKTYRLTYTVNEMDGGKRVSSDRFAMVLTDGQETNLKENSKVPIVTGHGGIPGVQTSFSYMDVGMNFQATLTALPSGAMLRSSVDQTTVANTEKLDDGYNAPVVRQASIKGQSFVTAGKSIALGSLDIPGSTRHLEIEVVMEPIS